MRFIVLATAAALLFAPASVAQSGPRGEYPGGGGARHSDGFTPTPMGRHTPQRHQGHKYRNAQVDYSHRREHRREGHRGAQRRHDRHFHDNRRYNDHRRYDRRHAHRRHYRDRRYYDHRPRYHAPRRYYRPPARPYRYYGYAPHYGPRWVVGAAYPFFPHYRRYEIINYNRFGLARPPHRHAWVRHDNDAVLIALATGLIAGVAFNACY